VRISDLEYDVRIEQVAAQPLAVVRRCAPASELAKVVPEACGTVWNALRALQVTGTGRHVAVYWDGEINLEVGVEVASPFGGCGEVVDSTTPAGTVATTTHLGPYNQLKHAHEALHQYCKSHGLELARPCWEVFGHWQDDWNRDPSKIRTDVFYRVVPAGSSHGQGATAS